MLSIHTPSEKKPPARCATGAGVSHSIAPAHASLRAVAAIALCSGALDSIALYSNVQGLVALYWPISRRW